MLETQAVNSQALNSNLNINSPTQANHTNLSSGIQNQQGIYRPGMVPHSNCSCSQMIAETITNAVMRAIDWVLQKIGINFNVGHNNPHVESVNSNTKFNDLLSSGAGIVGGAFSGGILGKGLGFLKNIGAKVLSAGEKVIDKVGGFLKKVF